MRPADISDTEKALDALFFASASAQREKPAMFLPSATITFGELAAAAEKVAASLAPNPRKGVAAILARNKVEALASFFGVLKSGRPVFLTDPELSDAERRALLARLRPEYILSDDRLAIRKQEGAIREAADEDFYWGLSSGTTGQPKLFARSHASWIASFAASEAVFPFRPNDVAALPGLMSHSLFLFGAVQALTRGLSVAMLDGFHPRAAARHFAASGASVLWCVPSMLQAFAASGFADWQPRLIFSGGAKLKESMRHAIESALPEADLVEFYGSSELSFVTYASTSHPAPANSVGRAFPDVDIRVCGEGGEALAPGREGLVEVRSPMTYSRYLGAEPGQDRHAAEWSTAGDLGYLDASGFLHLTGRQARVINTKGLKLSAEPIEQALLECDGVEAAAVVGLPDERRGEVIAAFIVPRVEFAGVNALLEQCRTRLAPRQRPRRIFLAEALPMTRSGKVAVAEIKAMVEAGDPRFREFGR